MVPSTICHDHFFTGVTFIFPSDWRYVLKAMSKFQCELVENGILLKLSSFISLIKGIIYDVIVEPPSVGSTTDENGHSRPVSH